MLSFLGFSDLPPAKPPLSTKFVMMRTGFADKESSLKLEISEILDRAEPEFAELLKERAGAA